MTQIPFARLPLRLGDPPFSAWGLWGDEDNIGTLNWLSPEVVREAASEIKEGKRFSLNWAIHKPITPGFGRHACTFTHKISPPAHISASQRHINQGPQLAFNTQRSSQWDGLRHFAYQKDQLFYNNVTLREIMNGKAKRLGLNHWHTAGGIAGRGILIDYALYAEEQGHSSDATRDLRISFEQFEDCLRWQNESSTSPLEIRQGDIILLRTGFMRDYSKLSEEQERKIGTETPPRTPGMAQDTRLLKWLWDHSIAAVGGDSPSWECFPPVDPNGFLFHEALIAGWGCPIAEYLWLEDLSKQCNTSRRWSFFVSSSPLNVEGGVGSPANMMAIM
ncbi:hypothetical protein BJX66DRAFT_330521 [Aspergillus keveii]|uniref:Cyclase n=1 Tax=Aspergillus keveii TaxID=714993 RepID=A0ABR4FK60_9EURO